DGDWLDAICLKREHRKGKADGKITLNKQLYEVTPRFIGKSIELRYDERGVYVYEEGKRVAEAIRVRLEDNAYVKRHRSTFAAIPAKEGEHGV
ncbi:Mu transposase C-terminal domain-containing protein, partial [Geobacillus stearothermophilus]